MALYQRVMWLSGRAHMALSLRADGSGLPRFATGYYVTETVAEVTVFQERNNLSVDGKTGEQTLALIYSPDARESASRHIRASDLLKNGA